MKPYIFNLINAIVLMTFPFWAYLTSEKPSVTFLIPVAFGIILLALTMGIKKENKVTANIAVLVTLLVFFSLLMPLMGSIKRENWTGVIRVSIMLFFTFLAFVSFIKNFINARKKNN